MLCTLFATNPPRTTIVTSPPPSLHQWLDGKLCPDQDDDQSDPAPVNLFEDEVRSFVAVEDVACAIHDIVRRYINVSTARATGDTDIIEVQKQVQCVC